MHDLICRALDELPYVGKKVETPGHHEYTGLELSSKICGVEIIRAGGAMRTSFSRIFNDAAIGKILIHTSEIGEPLLHFVKLPNQISSHRVFVMVLPLLEKKVLMMIGRADCDPVRGDSADGYTHFVGSWSAGGAYYFCHHLG